MTPDRRQQPRREGDEPHTPETRLALLEQAHDHHALLLEGMRDDAREERRTTRDQISELRRDVSNLRWYLGIGAGIVIAAQAVLQIVLK